MANGRGGGKRQRIDTDREPGRFFAMPVSVMESSAYLALSHAARALLFELALQCKGDDNGRLLLSRAYLAKRGWTSADTIQRAKMDLLSAGFIHETVKGHRPNRASWYAVTWRTLNDLQGFDAGAKNGFVRGAYRMSEGKKNATLIPAHGTGSKPIGPAHGTGAPVSVPANGAIRAVAGVSAVPSDGHPLEMPSLVVRKAAA